MSELTDTPPPPPPPPPPDRTETNDPPDATAIPQPEEPDAALIPGPRRPTEADPATGPEPSTEPASEAPTKDTTPAAVADGTRADLPDLPVSQEVDDFQREPGPLPGGMRDAEAVPGRRPATEGIAADPLSVAPASAGDEPGATDGQPAISDTGSETEVGAEPDGGIGEAAGDSAGTEPGEQGPVQPEGTDSTPGTSHSSKSEAAPGPGVGRSAEIAAAESPGDTDSDSGGAEVGGDTEDESATSSEGDSDRTGTDNAGDGTEQRLLELARDPGQGGKITPKTMQEALAAYDLEQSGDLPAPVTRSEDPAADFLDGTGQEWDVKGFHSGFPPSQGGYDLDTSMTKIEAELNRGENVILDTSKLTEADSADLGAAVDAKGWSERVLWWP
jgi:hypothetical protein